ncbi:MAG: DUF1800 family protein, partial [Pseudomonadota bacterium]
MATSAIAQEISNATPVVSSTPAAETTASEGNVVVPLKISAAMGGTYVFMSPADNPVTITLDGTVILTGANGAADPSASPLKVITSLTAGEHLVEISGKDISMEQIALVSFYELGGTAQSIANISQALTAQQAADLSAMVAMQAGSVGASAGVQMASAQAATSGREPFVIGGGSSRSANTSRAEPVLAAAGTSAPATMSETESTSASTTQTMQASTATTSTTSSGGGGIFRRSVQSGIDIIQGDGGSGTPGMPGSPTTPGVTPGTPVTPPAGTPLPPVVLPANMARASELTPPTDVVLNQAVQIVGGATETGVVAETGQTLFGDVMDPMTFDIVNATFMQSTREVTVDVGATTGQFALRVFPEDIVNGAVSVTITGANSANSEVTSVPVMYEFTASPAADGITQALSRVTYGATPELYARVRSIGFDAYVNEQLAPETINDPAFTAMGFDRMLRRDDTNAGNILRQLFRHDLATSAFTEKQLQDVMGSFWHNHFHATTKDSGVIVQNIDDRAFYRENAFGSFEDLLLYSARSPVMSQFLDNDNSRDGRLNENYAREILELHTVGVDAGYTPEDIIEIAKIFTGWRYRQTNENADEEANEYEFFFDEGRHNDDPKTISFLGNLTIAPAGVQEGEQLIAVLADRPETQAFVCGKIVQKFVADDPPMNFVNICRTAWTATDGDMGEVLRAILTAPEFISTVELQRTKGKTPYEYAVG